MWTDASREPLGVWSGLVPGTRPRAQVPGHTALCRGVASAAWCVPVAGVCPAGRRLAGPGLASAGCVVTGHVCSGGLGRGRDPAEAEEGVGLDRRGRLGQDSVS